MANRARPARDGIYPEGEIRFTYEGEPMDGYSVLAAGRATVNGTATLRSKNISRRSIAIKITSGGPLDVGPAGVTAGTAWSLDIGDALVLERGSDARIDVACTVPTDIQFIEEQASPDVPH